MRWLFALWLAGCGFQGAALTDGAVGATETAVPGGEVTIPTPDAGVDGGTTTLTCLQKWHAGTVQLSAPHHFTELSTTGADRDIFATDDGLTVYFSRNSKELTATRTTPDGTFSSPTALTIANNTSKFSLMADGVTAAVAVFESGNYNVQLWHRANPTATTFTYDGEIGAAATGAGIDDYDPEISANGLALYWAPTVAGQHIWATHRATTSDTFTNPGAPVTDLGTANAADPTYSPDEKLLLYSMNNDINYATRDDVTQPFVARGVVPGLSKSGSNGSDAHLTSDGCRVYFARNAFDGNDWELYSADVL